MLSRHLRHLTHFSNTSVTCCVCPVHTTDRVRLQNPAVIVEVVELLHEVSATDCNCSAALRYSSCTLLSCTVVTAVSCCSYGTGTTACITSQSMLSAMSCKVHIFLMTYPTSSYRSTHA
jgi:hypothetical protein